MEAIQKKKKQEVKSNSVRRYFVKKEGQSKNLERLETKGRLHKKCMRQHFVTGSEPGECAPVAMAFVTAERSPLDGCHFPATGSEQGKGGPARRRKSSTGRKYGFDDQDVIDKRNTDTLKVEAFENVLNARPAQAHIRNRKL
ncbi:hypothetical protein OSTOST_09106, partial [Ostertagia ostertagi]